MSGKAPNHKRSVERAPQDPAIKMGRLLVLVVLLLLLCISIFCISAGEKDHRFHIGHAVGKPSRSEPSWDRSGLCPCPGSQKQRKHKHVCPCDGFVVSQSGRHRRHSHRKNQPLPRHLKQKCRSPRSNCQHRHLMKGLQIPL